MLPASSSIDSLQGFIRQFGVADSGDALAILRSLGLSINEALSGAVQTQRSDLQSRIDRLELRRQQLDRLATGEPIGDFIAWPVDEANALRASLSSPDDPDGPFGPFETFVRFQRELITDSGTTTEQGTTIAGQADWLSDYTRSTNAQGQVVWTKVDSEAGETIVFTELETLAGVPKQDVDQLKFSLIMDIAQTVLSTFTQSTQLRYTLVEWLGEVRIDERWMKFARSTEERRSDAQLAAVKQELTALLERLHDIGREAVDLPLLSTPGSGVPGAPPSPAPSPFPSPSTDSGEPTREDPPRRGVSRPDAPGG